MALGEEAVEDGGGRGRETELGEIEEGRSPVEQPEHDAFAEAGRHERDADVDVPPGDAEPDATVLREATLGDVEPRHDLHPRGQGCVHAGGRGEDAVEDAVDAESHGSRALEGFEVDVARAGLHRLEEERVHQPDDGGLVARFEEVERSIGGRMQGIGAFGKLEDDAGPRHRLHCVACRRGRRIVGARDRVAQRRSRHDQRAEAGLEEKAEVVERGEGGRVGDCDGEPVVLPRERQHEVAPRVGHRESGEELARRQHRQGGCEGETGGARQRAREGRALHEPGLGQRLAERLAVALADAIERLGRDAEGGRRFLVEGHGPVPVSLLRPGALHPGPVRVGWWRSPRGIPARIRSRSRSEFSAICSSVAMMCGVKKTSRFVFMRRSSLCRKSAPSTGIRLK